MDVHGIFTYMWVVSEVNGAAYIPVLMQLLKHKLLLEVLAHHKILYEHVSNCTYVQFFFV